MLPRRGRWGLFWGCASFETTGCKVTRRAAPSAASGGYAVLEMDTLETFRLHIVVPPPTRAAGAGGAEGGGGGGGGETRLRELIAAAGLSPLRIDSRPDGVTGAVFSLDAHSTVRRRLAATAPLLLLLPIPAPTFRYFQRRRGSPPTSQSTEDPDVAESPEGTGDVTSGTVAGRDGGGGGGEGGGDGGGPWWRRRLPEEMRRSLLPFQAPRRPMPSRPSMIPSHPVPASSSHVPFLLRPLPLRSLSLITPELTRLVPSPRHVPHTSLCSLLTPPPPPPAALAR
jgi:hypothetical protein